MLADRRCALSALKSNQLAMWPQACCARQPPWLPRLLAGQYGFDSTVYSFVRFPGPGLALLLRLSVLLRYGPGSSAQHRSSRREDLMQHSEEKNTAHGK